MSHEMENLSIQVDVNAINAAMMKYVIWAYGENISKQGYLPGSAKQLASEMMLIAAEVDQHFQREGSLDGLKVQVGSCLTINDQDFYIRNSLISGLIDPKEMEGLNIRSLSRWPSAVEGLEIRREDQGGRFGYFLADKRPNWVETG